MTLMGMGTFFIGLLPSYASAGIIAPVILIGLRLAQGLALGGEYGGAAIYVGSAEEQARAVHFVDPDHSNGRPVHGAVAGARHPHQPR